MDGSGKVCYHGESQTNQITRGHFIMSRDGPLKHANG